MDKNLRICTIGGGSGMPIVNSGLVTAGFKNISSIVTTFDSGGDSGRMRTDERGNLLAFSDYWRAIMSLWENGKQKLIWEEMLRFRDGRGRNFGNMFFQFMSEKSGSLSEVDLLFSKLMGVKLKGEVIPVSLHPAQLCFETKSGKVYRGEHMLDELRMSFDRVYKIWLEPEVRISVEAASALAEAEVIIVCPGSMYGSVMTNFLPKKAVDIFIKSKAKKILMTNIMSTANENKGFSQKDYIKIFEKLFKKKNVFDLILMADLDRLKDKKISSVLKFYEMEHSEPIKIAKDCGVKTLVEDIAIIEEKNLRLRHSADKLAKVFLEMII
jgi:uncharacterized cofD-like protein